MALLVPGLPTPGPQEQCSDLGVGLGAWGLAESWTPGPALRLQVTTRTQACALGPAHTCSGQDGTRTPASLVLTCSTQPCPLSGLRELTPHGPSLTCSQAHLRRRGKNLSPCLGPAGTTLPRTPKAWAHRAALVASPQAFPAVTSDAQVQSCPRAAPGRVFVPHPPPVSVAPLCMWGRRGPWFKTSVCHCG